ncbi:MAG: hypothetical protein P4L50_06395 [Anaerolineaceae bacterium]|nr:hypothetical protein [Anaerolineaceae bacterium]
MNLIPEKNKKAGVCYAFSDDGLELPVIDITHPAFAFEMDDAKLNALIDTFARSTAIPPAALQSAAQKSILVRGFVESAGTFTTGMMTYLNKLEPDNLGEGYAGPLDRQWAASLSPVTFRWRMRHVARLLADGLSKALAARPAVDVHLINIAGGPAVDSLNALILLHKENPAQLAGRQIAIHVFDLDDQGPHFGARTLESLLADGAPLNGLRVRFEHIPYNWSQPAVLQETVARLDLQHAAAAGSSEGGLFEYASDEDIVANLQVLRAGAPSDFVMVGPVVRSAQTLDERLKSSPQLPNRPAVRFIGLEAFQVLTNRAGWCIDRSLDGPMHQVVSLIQV